MSASSAEPGLVDGKLTPAGRASDEMTGRSDRRRADEACDDPPYDAARAPRCVRRFRPDDGTAVTASWRQSQRVPSCWDTTKSVPRAGTSLDRAGMTRRPRSRQADTEPPMRFPDTPNRTFCTERMALRRDRWSRQSRQGVCGERPIGAFVPHCGWWTSTLDLARVPAWLENRLTVILS